ncbi:MAG TPA: PLP-dependent aminotransferase family protein [Polyangiaceae bacterium]
MDLGADYLRHLQLERLQRRSAEQPGVLGLSGGLPAPETFPLKSLGQALAGIGRDALQYDWPEGRSALREWVARHLRARDVSVEPDEILITSGAQQALDVALQVSTEPESSIGVPDFCYPLALALFRARGMTPEPKLVAEATEYTMPAVGNPTGLALDPAERVRLLARRRPILEDDAYGDLRFSRSITPLRTSAPERVFLIGTFSKTLCPGLRVGWLVAPHGFRDLARRAKQLSDLQANTLAQAIVERYLTLDDFEARLDWLRTFYERRAHALVEALRRRVPALQFREPEGGFSLWCELDEPGEDTELLACALRHGVSFDPGSDFQTNPRRDRLNFRLAFSSLPPPRMDEAVARLGRALTEHRKRARGRVRRAAGVTP